MGNSAAKRQISQGKSDKSKYGNLIDNFSYSDPQFRQGLENPNAGVTNPFDGLTNQFATQRVATGAADYQSQQQDQSRANILDAVVQGGGGSAASATALAQSAAQSNQQISAGLQQQETQNQTRSAQAGQQIQQLQATGEQRRQQLVGAGEQYITGLAENRAQSELAGLGNQYAGAQQTINSGYESIASNNAAYIGAAGSIIGGALGGAGAAGGFSKLLG